MRRNHGAGRERPYPDRDIDAVFDGVQNLIAEQKAQGDIGVRLLEFARERQEMKMSHAPRRRDREIACRSQILARGLFLRIVDLFDDPLACLDIGSPGVGERQPP